MRVSMNDFIATRGRSGSSRAADLIATALGEFHEVSSVFPRSRPRGRFLRLTQMLWWDFIAVPTMAWSNRSDVIVHCTNTGGPSLRAPSVVVLHDVMVLDHPEHFDRAFRAYARATFAISVRFSRVVVTPSNHSRAKILARWPTASVEVIPWPVFTKLDSHAVVKEPVTRNVLIVSSLDKHKRIPMAIEAVARLRHETQEDFRATLVVRKGNDSDAFQLALRSHDPGGRWTTVVQDISDQELQETYRNSFCLLVSSLDEGFCLPALEASIAGIPVVHAGRGALPEIVPREIIVPVNPSQDIDELVAQMLTIRDVSIWRKWRSSTNAAHERFSREAFASKWRIVVEKAVDFR